MFFPIGEEIFLYNFQHTFSIYISPLGLWEKYRYCGGKGDVILLAQFWKITLSLELRGIWQVYVSN